MDIGRAPQTEEDYSQEIIKAFGKIQTGIEIFLVNQLKELNFDVDKEIVKDTMSNLISNIPLDPENKDKSKVLIEMLKASPEILSVFCDAIRIKVALATQTGTPGEGFKIIKNLKMHGIQAVHIDSQPRTPENFVALANDFVLLCNTLDTQKVEIDETWARQMWQGGDVTNQVSLGNIPTQIARSPYAPSIGNERTVIAGTSTANAGFDSPDDRYELLELIGEGGFGKVHKAHDNLLNRVVAIKRYLSTQKSDIEIKRIIKEAKAVARLNHPLIIHIYDVIPDEVGLSVVMEYFKGLSLRHYLHHNRLLSLPDTCKVMGLICDALSYAHSKGVIHRDLKPENILCDESLRNIKVVDFGLAKIDNTESLTCTGQAAGTILYMAPEQLKDAKHIDNTVDIFAIGKMMYEMITGEMPTSIDESLLPDQEDIRDIIAKCTRALPTQRYQTVKEISELIKAISLDT